MEEVLLGVVARVVQVEVPLHVPVHVFRLNLEQQTVCVRVQQLAARAVFLLEVSVIKLVHHNLKELQDAHSDLNGAVELELGPVCEHAREPVAAKDGVPIEQGAGGELPHLFRPRGGDKVHVHPVSQVFHRFAEERVVHQFKKVLFEIRRGLLP